MGPDEKQYQVIVSPGANDRMADHFEFMARVSEPAATRLVDALIKDIRSLGQNPMRNPVYTKQYITPGKYRYLLSSKRYRIVYTVEENTVYVDDIQDCRQDDDKSLLFPKE